MIQAEEQGCLETDKFGRHGAVEGNEMFLIGDIPVTKAIEA